MGARATYGIKLYLLLISLVLALLASTKYFLEWKQQSPRLPTEFLSSPFYYAHVIDPAIDGYQFTSWTSQEWISWLNHRTKPHEIAWLKRHRNFRGDIRSINLNRKGLNTVMIASSSEITNAFQRRLPYNPNDPRSNLFWSEALFPLFVFKRRNNGSYQIFQCPPMYIVVGLVDGLPVHIHELSKRQEMGDYKANIKKDCKEIY